MQYKPMKLKEYERWISEYGCYLEKGSIDWKLKTKEGHFLCYIKIAHPGPKEVTPDSVKRTRNKLKQEGLMP